VGVQQVAVVGTAAQAVQQPDSLDAGDVGTVGLITYGHGAAPEYMVVQTFV
jgi:hypothetical protein